eukprot:5846894-Pleurochrysis_carterae.AAC.1
MDALRGRGWYVGSRGPVPALPTSPIRICPRGAVPCKDGGPPRGVAEEGWPRQDTVTADIGEPVDSLNNSSGKRRGLPPSDFWVDESKPTLADAALNLIALAPPARMLHAATLVILFDFKYFFRQFSYALHSAWKMGLAAPATGERGDASGDDVWALLEL